MKGGLLEREIGFFHALREAGATSGEPLWRMPLVADYEDGLSSPVADADNAPKGPGGAIHAALFLQHFTGGLPWALMPSEPSPPERKRPRSARMPSMRRP